MTTKPLSDYPEMMTLDEVATVLRCNRSTVRRKIVDDGVIPGTKELTGKWLVRRDDLEVLVRQGVSV